MINDFKITNMTEQLILSKLRELPEHLKHMYQDDEIPS